MSAGKEVRNRAIAMLAGAGLSQVAISQRFGITTMRVRQILWAAKGIVTKGRRTCGVCGNLFWCDGNNAGRFCSSDCAGTPDHSPEFIAEVRARWDHGESIRTIARGLQHLMPGCTLNVIVGIAYRNHFPKRESPIKKRAADAVVQRKTAPAVTRPARVQRKYPVPAGGFTMFRGSDHG